VPSDQSDNCTFCRMVRGETASRVVYEDEISFSFLDHRPLFPGHCLLVTREHIETLSDLPVSLIKPFFANTQLLARAVERGLLVDGTFVAINNRVSQSVPHLHVHIVPRRRKDGLKGFFWPRQSYRDEEHLTKVQESLRAAISEIQLGSAFG
jgi:histidine triad (HIT) family protein